MGHLNVRSLRNKMEDLRLLLENKSVDILASFISHIKGTAVYYLRHGMDEELLANFTLTIGRLIAMWINVLYLGLGTLPAWPSAEQASHWVSNPIEDWEPRVSLVAFM